MYSLADLFDFQANINLLLKFYFLFFLHNLKAMRSDEAICEAEDSGSDTDSDASSSSDGDLDI